MGVISGFPTCLLSTSPRFSSPFTSSPTITEEAFNSFPCLQLRLVRLILTLLSVVI